MSGQLHAPATLPRGKSPGILRFHLPIFIPPVAPQSLSSIIWDWYNRPIVAVPSGLGLTPIIIIVIIKIIQEGTKHSLIQLTSALPSCLSYYMELSPSSEAASCAAAPELASILWNPKVLTVFIRALRESLF
jgi:hypothetical protein